ncbi:MAG: hypothetical protein ACREWE_10130 [Gammaproteobacteria bacterium]
MADRPGVRYAVTVENPNTDPVVMALAIRDKGTCEVLIPKDRYDPLAVLAMIEDGRGGTPSRTAYGGESPSRNGHARRVDPGSVEELRVVRLRP